MGATWEERLECQEQVERALEIVLAGLLLIQTYHPLIPGFADRLREARRLVARL